MTFESLHYFEINISDRPLVITHYSLIWIIVDVKWLLLDQFELQEAEIFFDTLAKVL